MIDFRSLNLSILVATPPGYNPGMSAVEAGLRLFLRQHGLESAATVYRIHTIAERMKAEERSDPDLLAAAASSGLACQPLAGDGQRDRFLAGDRILYWGDFLHMAQYLRALEQVDAGEGDHAPGQRKPSIQDHLLMADVPDDVLARTCSFGTTLLFNSLEDETSASYGDALARFVTGSRGIWVRDVISAGKVAQLSGDFRSGFWGGDGAQLLSRRGIAELYPECAQPQRCEAVGYFTGRSGAPTDTIARTAARLAGALDLQARWLPWGSRSAFPALVPDDAHVTLSFPHLLRQLLQCRMVVTDTYHLGVVAWALGIPAVMFFQPSTPAPRNVNSGRRHYWRDKREVFYSQYDILDFLVRPEEAADESALAARVTHIASGMAGSALLDAIAARVGNHARATSSDLAHALAGQPE